MLHHTRKTEKCHLFLLLKSDEICYN